MKTLSYTHVTKMHPISMGCILVMVVILWWGNISKMSIVCIIQNEKMFLWRITLLLGVRMTVKIWYSMFYPNGIYLVLELFCDYINIREEGEEVVLPRPQIFLCLLGQQIIPFEVHSWRSFTEGWRWNKWIDFYSFWRSSGNKTGNSLYPSAGPY